MLVLTRKSNESVIIGNNIEVRIIEIHGEQVRLGFSAPREVAIHRKEIYDTICQENTEAAGQGKDDIQTIERTLSLHFADRQKTDLTAIHKTEHHTTREVRMV